MRRRPSAATAVALVALFVSLSGTAFAAGVVVTRNSQVAAHTIAGANAPGGDNQNLVAGSLGSADLHSGAVTGAKLAANAVTGSKIADGSVAGSKIADNTITGSDVDESTLATVPNASTLGGSPPSAFFPSGNVARASFAASGCLLTPCSSDFLTIGGLTLKGTCSGDYPLGSTIGISATGAANSVASAAYITGDGTAVNNTDVTDLVEVGAPTGAADGGTGTIVYAAQNGATVSVSFVAIVHDFSGGGAKCSFDGTALVTT